MFAMDVPYVPVRETPTVLAQSEKSGNSVAPDFILNSCKETEHTRDGTGEGANTFVTLDPAASYRWYIDATPLINSDDCLCFRACEQALHPNNVWRNGV